MSQNLTSTETERSQGTSSWLKCPNFSFYLSATVFLSCFVWFKVVNI